MSRDETQPEDEDSGPFFHAPVPGPLFPPAPGKNLVFWTETDSASGREHEDIMLRRVPSAVAHRFRGAAGARGLTHAQYLSALVALHETTRQLADAGDAELAALLEQLGLRTVSI